MTQLEIKPTYAATGSRFEFIDLFAGIGGFHLGMKANGGVCVFASEYDKYAAKTYKEWTNCQNLDTSDIRDFDLSKIPSHDVLCAGFPCQPFSLAGVSKKNSLGRKHGFDDEKQGNLFYSIRDIAVLKKTPILLLENVKNLISHDKGNTWKTIQSELDQAGYSIVFKVIDAKGWVPQHRERIFIVCFRKDDFTDHEISSFSFPNHAKMNKYPMLQKILDPNPEKKYMLTDNLWVYLQNYAAKHKAAGNGFGFSIAKPEGISRTISARYHKDGSEILLRQKGWKNPRRLTPSEAAKLMGFKPSLAVKAKVPGGKFKQVVSDTQAYKQFGNSVCPLIVQDIGSALATILDARKERLSLLSQ